MMKKDDRQISIRINGKETKLEEQDPARETAAAEDNEDEFQWVLPDQGNISKKVIDFQKHFEDRQHGQPIMNEEEERQGEPIFAGQRKRKRSGPFSQKKMSFTTFPKKVIYAILAAIIIGLIFGLLMLMLFTQKNIFSESMQKSEQSESLPTAAMKAGPLQLDLIVYVVQGGAYSTQDKGIEAMNNVKENGYAAVLDTNEDPMSMLIGVTLSNEAAGLLSDMYKQNGQDTYKYKKEVKLSNQEQFIEEQEVVLASGKQVYEKLLNITAYQLTEANPLNKEEWQEVKNQFQEWEQQLKGVSFEDSHAKQVEQFKTTLKEAVVSFHVYTTSNKKEELWKTEQLLLDTFIAYKNLLQ
ncbi:hypothetical protein [Bacillus taeanensis]|uniref:Stage II sporulation protein B n=1 Tax=Bacillus taeanensis TaxID=273032 RepID=A0A366XZL4_9BACI|nr:hypothetical protein [Bacillus taeanensis]RBW71592.1 hypothetical protein DS031_02260 [Bacillus taeanensis]